MAASPIDRRSIHGAGKEGAFHAQIALTIVNKTDEER